VYRLTLKYASAVKETSAHAGEEHGSVELKLLRTLHQTIAKITEDFSGRWHFNTCVSAIMILVNQIADAEPAMDAGEVGAPVIKHVFETLALLLAPFAPFLAAEMWEMLGHADSVTKQTWPVADAKLAKESEIEIPVQANGKLIVVVKVPADADENSLKAAALADEKVQQRLEGLTLVKTIVVKSKLVNLVVR
jgi:leucyl-tRNA synthetase